MRPDREHGRGRSSRSGCATSPATTGGAEPSRAIERACTRAPGRCVNHTGVETLPIHQARGATPCRNRLFYSAGSPTCGDTCVVYAPPNLQRGRNPSQSGGAGKVLAGSYGLSTVSGAGGRIRRPKTTGVALDRTALPVPLPVAPAETSAAPVGGRWSPTNAARDRPPFVRRGPRAAMSHRPRWSAVRSGIVRWPRSCVRRPDRQRRSPRGRRPRVGPPGC